MKQLKNNIVALVLAGGVLLLQASLFPKMLIHSMNSCWERRILVMILVR